MAYIEDTNLIEEIKSLKISLGGKDIFPDEAKESVLRVISEQPTADVVEVKHGTWLDYKQKITTPAGVEFEAVVGYRCSLCGRTEIKREPYCNCGAKMDGGKAE
jgi:hypothetical protein